MLIFQVLVFVVVSTLNITLDIEDHGKCQYVVLYEIVLCSWFYLAAFYFLKVILKDSIVVYLIVY